MLSGAILVFIFADIPTAAYKKGHVNFDTPLRTELFCIPMGSRTPIVGTGIRYSIH